MSFFSSRSVLCRQTSTMCAPPRTWRRAISLASSHFSSATRFLKRREPITLVRSPTSNGRGTLARLFALGHLRQGANMLLGGAAAAADEIQPAVIDEFLELGGQRGWRLE